MEIRYCLEFTRGRATTVKKKKNVQKGFMREQSFVC